MRKKISLFPNDPQFDYIKSMAKAEINQFKFTNDLITAMIRNGNYLGLKIFKEKGYLEITDEDIQNASHTAENLINLKPGGAAGRRGY